MMMRKMRKMRRRIFLSFFYFYGLIRKGCGFFDVIFGFWFFALYVLVIDDFFLWYLWNTRTTLILLTTTALRSHRSTSGWRGRRFHDGRGGRGGEGLGRRRRTDLKGSGEARDEVAGLCRGGGAAHAEEPDANQRCPTRVQSFDWHNIIEDVRHMLLLVGILAGHLGRGLDLLRHQILKDFSVVRETSYQPDKFKVEIDNAAELAE